MRIVSLLPSATEIVCLLGLESQLVGVTHECDWPPSVRGKPRVTRSRLPATHSSAQIDADVRGQLAGGESLYSLDFDAVRELQPDLIITQTLCAVCAVDDREVRRFVEQISGGQAATGQAAPRVIYLEPTRLEDIFANLLEVGQAAGVAHAAQAAVERLRARVTAVTARAVSQGAQSHSAQSQGAQHRPRVVVLEWLDPLFSCGHWTPELVALAGGIEPLAEPGARSRQIDVAALIAADPDVLIAACCGYTREQSLHDLRNLLCNPAVAGLRCVREGRTAAVDGSAYFSRPGPRIVDSLEILAHLIDPDRHPLDPRLQQTAFLRYAR